MVMMHQVYLSNLIYIYCIDYCLLEYSQNL